MQPEQAELRALYRRYLERCNEHRFDELDEFVADDVEVNGVRRSRQEYGDGLHSVVEQFPDFSWQLQHLLVDGNWLAAHLDDTGTSRAGRHFTLREFAMYRIDSGRIAAVWGDLDRDRFPSH